jgi:hypothetical protein
MKGFKPRSNLEKDKNGSVAYSYNIWNRKKNYFSHLLIIHGVNDAKQKYAYS